MENNKVDQIDLLKDDSFVEWVKNPTPALDKQWEGWVNSNPGKKEVVDEAIELINSIEYDERGDLSVEEIKQIYQPVRDMDSGIRKTNGKSIRLNFGYWSKIAAILVVVAVSTFLLMKYQEKDTGRVASSVQGAFTRDNPTGVKSTFELPDGTMVKMNAESSLTFESDTINNKRLVRLSGEAFFDVFHDKARPFTVVSNGISTTALGTSFNVRAYPQEKTNKVFLVSGVVQVERVNHQDGSNILLAPGFGASFDRGSQSLTQISFDYDTNIGWKEGLLSFNSSNQREVFEKLERWYGVEISVTKGNKRLWNLSAKFDNKPLESVLNSLSRTENFSYKISGKKVEIKF
ncbi:MAG: DUF4974 domain-containing protein [Cyclobacteriaceae bacterium]